VSGGGLGEGCIEHSVGLSNAAKGDSQTEQSANLCAHHAVQSSGPTAPNRCSKILHDPRWAETGMQKAEERMAVLASCRTS